MSRPKVYDFAPLPKKVTAIVRAVCADYDRRARALRGNTIDEAVRANYCRLNTVVDLALAAVEEPMIRAEILRDMIAGRGYERSRARPYLCDRAYYRRRRMVLFGVAKRLDLC